MTCPYFLSDWLLQCFGFQPAWVFDGKSTSLESHIILLSCRNSLGNSFFSHPTARCGRDLWITHNNWVTCGCICGTTKWLSGKTVSLDSQLYFLDDFEFVLLFSQAKHTWTHAVCRLSNRRLLCGVSRRNLRRSKWKWSKSKWKPCEEQSCEKPLFLVPTLELQFASYNELIIFLTLIIAH